MGFRSLRITHSPSSLPATVVAVARTGDPADGAVCPLAFIIPGPHTRTMGQTPTLGIDLGTTNSAVSIVDTGEPILIKNHNQRLLTPSVVRFPLPDSDREHPLVGVTARNTRKQYPTYTVSSVKREMGTDTTYQFDGDQYTPPEVASYILSTLKFAASDALEIPRDQLTDVVITVPAYFSETQRQATRTAAEMAEFERIELLNEPTAAAIADGYQAGGRVEDVLVYDLGGGTFDVSVVKVGQDTFRVRATGGDESLGGDDWDQALTEWAATQIEQAHDVNPFDPQPDEDPAITASRRARLREKVRQAKESLCAEGRPAEITLPYFMHDHTDSPISVELTLDMDTLTRVTDHLIEQTIDPVRDAIAESDSSIQDLDDVVLVGGATRMPQVRRRLETLLGRRIQPPSDPDYAVAKGAAIKGKQGSVILQEVTPLALGVGVAHGKFEPVIPRNTPLPADGSTMLTTSKPNQTAARIEIYQGQADLAEENRYLDTFFISGIAPAAPGIPQIRVEFDVDLQGLITVTAESVDSLSGDIKNTLRIEGSNDISQDTIDAHIERVQNQREKESQRVALIEQLSTLEEHISQAKQLRTEYAETLSQDETEALQTAVETGQRYLDEDTTTLEELTQHNKRFEHLLTEIGTNAVSRDRHGPKTLDQSATAESPDEQHSSESDSQPTFDIADPSEQSQPDAEATGHTHQPTDKASHNQSQPQSQPQPQPPTNEPTHEQTQTDSADQAPVPSRANSQNQHRRQQTETRTQQNNTTSEGAQQTQPSENAHSSHTTDPPDKNPSEQTDTSHEPDTTTHTSDTQTQAQSPQNNESTLPDNSPHPPRSPHSSPPESDSQAQDTPRSEEDTTQHTGAPSSHTADHPDGGLGHQVSPSDPPTSSDTPPHPADTHNSSPSAQDTTNPQEDPDPTHTPREPSSDSESDTDQSTDT